MSDLSRSQKKKLYAIGTVCLGVSCLLVALVGVGFGISVGENTAKILCLLGIGYLVLRIVILGTKTSFPRRYPSLFPDIRFLAAAIGLIGVLLGTTMGMFITSLFV